MQKAYESPLGIKKKALSQESSQEDEESDKRRNKRLMHLAHEISFNEDVDMDEAKKIAEERMKGQSLVSKKKFDPSNLAESYNSHVLGK